MKENPFASHFSEDHLSNSRGFVDRLEEVFRKNFLLVVSQSGEEDVELKKNKRRRRRAGEFSGRQLALKKLEKEGAGPVLQTETWPPPFLETIRKMRDVLLQFAEGEEELFSADHATAMRVYFSKKLKVSGKVRPFINSSCNTKPTLGINLKRIWLFRLTLLTGLRELSAVFIKTSEWEDGAGKKA